MPLWTKNTFPKYLSAKQKRNVVATKRGFVRMAKVDGAPNEILVAIPGLLEAGGFANTAVVTAMWHSTASIVNGNPVDTYLSFNQPVQNLGGAVKLAVTGTGSPVAVAPANVTLNGNQLKFTWTPASAGTYSIGAQTASNATATAVSVRSSTENGNNAVSLVISSGLSTEAGSVVAS